MFRLAFCRSQVILESIMVGTVGKVLTEVNRAYIAGLIDADGAIMASIESHKEKRFGFRIRTVVKITQSNVKVLEWVKERLIVGRIVRNRSTFDWIVKNQIDVLEVLNQIESFSVGKKLQIEMAKKIISSVIKSKEDLLAVARMADTLAGFNVRSKNRRKNYAAKIEVSTSRND